MSSQNIYKNRRAVNNVFFSQSHRVVPRSPMNRKLDHYLLFSERLHQITQNSNDYVTNHPRPFRSVPEMYRVSLRCNWYQTSLIFLNYSYNDFVRLVL